MDIFNPTTWEILKVPSPDLSGFVPYNWATGDVDLWTHSYEWNTITLDANAWNDWFVLGTEILDDTGWTVNSWLDIWSTGWRKWLFTNLIRPVSLTVWKRYYISFNNVGYSEITNVSIGGFSSWFFELFTGAYTKIFIFEATTSDNLIINGNCSTWVLLISLKEINQEKLPVLLVKDKNGLETFNIYSSDATLKNLYMGKSSWRNTVLWANNIGLWENSLSWLISWYKNIALWIWALKNEDWFNNIAIGYSTLGLSTSSWGNIWIWNNVLLNCPYILSSVAIWNDVLKNYTWTWPNTVIGASSMIWTLWTSTWTYNTVVWNSSLWLNTTWWSNVALGYSALSQNTTWWSNVAIWNNSWQYYGSFSANQNSSQSIFLWGSTQALAVNWTNEIVIWYNTQGNGSNTVTLWNTSITKTYLRWDIYPVDAKNIVLGTTTGMKIGTATTQKLSFHNSTPVAQRAGAAQAAVATTGSTNITPYWFTTAAQANALVTLVNELRAAMVEKWLIKWAA